MPEGENQTAAAATGTTEATSQTTEQAAKPEGEQQQATTLLTEGETKATETAVEAEKKEGEKATETAVAFDAKALKPPEGITLRDEDVARLTPLAEKYKLSTEAVNDLLAVHGDVIKQLAAEPMKAWVDLNKTWVDAVKADPDLGNGQTIRPEVKAAISRVKAEYGDQDFTDALNITGAGNHPAVIRFLNKVSKVLVEGGHVGGRPGAGGPRGPSAEAMYPGGPRSAPDLKAG
jgi:hypothetical protein